MNQMHIISAAITFATERHAGQFDKAGMPYILHCLKVMHYTKTEDEELMSIAVLHDVIEDQKFTRATYQDLRAIGMTERVIDGVRCLTKVPGETYEEYKEKVKSNVDARKVKKSDLRHNSDIRRLKGVTDKDIARITDYQKFYMELQILDKEEQSMPEQVD